MAEWTDVFALAQRQHGLIERGQLASLGVSVSAVNRRAARELWPRVQPGVLALPGSVDSPERRIMAAVLATGGEVAAARWTAAYLWGLTDRLRVPLTVVIPHGRRAARLDAVKHLRSRTLRPEDASLRRGIRVTRPERTLADLAAVVTRPELRDLAIDLRQRRMIDVAVLWELYERTWPVRGHEHLKRVLLDLGGAKVDSGLEWRARGLCRRAGLPEPFPEPFPVEVGGRVVARVDIAWPAWKVGVECDGFRSCGKRVQPDADTRQSAPALAVGCAAMVSEAAMQGRLAEALGEAGGAWERGWVLAAMGRFADALTALGEAMTGPDRPRALGTRASVYRQLSLHELAERDDDAGLAATDDPAVRAGLLVGKVADALGLGLRDEWRPRVLMATEGVAAGGDWRQRLRLAWVIGETAMYEGAPEAATPYFAEAVTRAVEHGARRHEAKSHLFLGAAHAALGNTAAAQGHARAALSLARDTGAKPVQWAAALVLAEAGERPDEHVHEARRILEAVLDGLPADLRAAALTREPARWLLGG